ncbi:hypothetical protein MRB53_010227 [Persea americana]|uniref:Uncharacterized protein n=3 Tax=Persea americana TaxID=3435 RepID=A0ACC2LRC8_PERAE|nr:hypothetical protein MRB53_010225 [Persea americana]KAJ8635959.1 hypothetical protein MRB53_010226 [Persea americana]KAJ8635960.1 hypothetical protein MRB53_010227 [Persea americana]
MKPHSRWVDEENGSKGRFTNSAAERSALGSSEERLAWASMSFKTKTRASGSSFVIRGGSVKLDAVVLISHKSLFGYALRRDL